MAQLYSRLSGMGMDQVLEKLGLVRKPEETNWEFRKRAFPTLWNHYWPEHDSLAVEFLMLLPQDYWTEQDMTRYMFLRMEQAKLRGGYDKKRLSPQTEAKVLRELSRFAKGFFTDPFEYRKQGMFGLKPAPTDRIAEKILAEG